MTLPLDPAPFAKVSVTGTLRPDRAALYGVEESRRMAAVECRRAHETLAPFGVRAERLHELADLIVHRKS